MWLARARVSPASALDQGDHRRRLALAYASLRCTVSRIATVLASPASSAAPILELSLRCVPARRAAAQSSAQRATASRAECRSTSCALTSTLATCADRLRGQLHSVARQSSALHALLS